MLVVDVTPEVTYVILDAMSVNFGHFEIYMWSSNSKRR